MIEGRVANLATVVSKLETAIGLGYPGALVAADRNFRELQSEPEFRSLIDRTMPAGSDPLCFVDP